MASIAPDNPLKKTYELMTTLEGPSKVMVQAVKVTEAKLRAFDEFLKHVKKDAQRLGATIGKSAVKLLVSAGDQVLNLVRLLKSGIVEVLQMSQKVIKLILKAANPQKIFKTVKSLCARFAKAIRRVASFVEDLVKVLNPIQTALKLLETFKMALRLVLSWIADVGNVSKVMKGALKTIKKSQKAIRTQLRDVTTLMKEVNGLKPA